MYYLDSTSKQQLLQAKTTKPFNAGKNNRQDCMPQSCRFRQCMESGGSYGFKIRDLKRCSPVLDSIRSNSSFGVVLAPLLV